MIRVKADTIGVMYRLIPTMSFSCPHFRPDDEHCLRLNIDCVPGRRGCVLEGKAVFAVPVEERIRLHEAAKRERISSATGTKNRLR